MRYFLLPLVLMAALLGLSSAPANATSALAGLHAASGSPTVQVDYRWGGRRYGHRRWRNHRWYYYN
jgi:hypothetical protein